MTGPADAAVSATGEVRIRPVTGLPEIDKGDDLAALIAPLVPGLADGDVVVVSSKVVSKSEGRVVAGLDRRAATRAETVRVVAERGQTQIVATRHGFVMAAAGVDASNVDPGSVVLLPEDPDASARLLRRDLAERLRVRVGVVVTDTFGRPWRLGQTDLAVGAAGVRVIASYQGLFDGHGNELAVTAPALADELAAAADLVKGKLTGIPVAVVSGLGHLVTEDDGPGVRELVRDADADLFRLGTREAMREAVRLPNSVESPAEQQAEPVADVVAGVVSEVVSGLASGLVADERAERCQFELVRPRGPAVAVSLPPGASSTGALLAAGAQIERVRLALAVEGLRTSWSEADPADGRGPGHLGFILIGRT